MTRWLMVLVLLHHIEGVCKPLSAIKQAANQALTHIIGGIASAGAQRDRKAATERASQRQAAAIERARAAGARRRPGVGRREPAAIDLPHVVPDGAQYVREMQERDR